MSGMVEAIKRNELETVLQLLGEIQKSNRKSLVIY